MCRPAMSRRVCATRSRSEHAALRRVGFSPRVALQPSHAPRGLLRQAQDARACALPTPRRGECVDERPRLVARLLRRLSGPVELSAQTRARAARLHEPRDVVGAHAAHREDRHVLRQHRAQRREGLGGCRATDHRHEREPQCARLGDERGAGVRRHHQPAAGGDQVLQLRVLPDRAGAHQRPAPRMPRDGRNAVLPLRRVRRHLDAGDAFFQQRVGMRERLRGFDAAQDRDQRSPRVPAWRCHCGIHGSVAVSRGTNNALRRPSRSSTRTPPYSTRIRPRSCNTFKASLTRCRDRPTT